MPTKITIENLRHIRKLEFTIPNSGTWLLTGANGTGKTSLLACMRRIGFNNAFPKHFPTSQISERLDSYEGSSVTYEINNSRVTYRYRGERWVPFPKANSGLLRDAGYPDVRYIAADATRIEPRPEDFEPRRARAANQEIISAANDIFDTRKFENLKTINTKRGVGSDAFLLERPNTEGRNNRHFISEKNFSLGELCVLKLLRLLRDCPRGSLVLVDELELALHPMAQVTLLQYLNKISEEKTLTIIVSTHSATLIKQTPANRILLLQPNEEGEVNCTKNCFPSLVLGAIAYNEESAADVIVYCEDDAAQTLIEQFSMKFIQNVYQNDQLIPTVQAIPVGGMTNVLRFFVRQRPLLPAITRAYIVLDADAEDGIEAARSPDIVRIRDQNRNHISYLPMTPEVGLTDLLSRDLEAVIRSLREHYRIIIQIQRRVVGNIPAPQDRDEHKALIKRVCENIAHQIPNGNHQDVKTTLLKIYANHYFQSNRQNVMALMGPIIRG